MAVHHMPDVLNNSPLVPPLSEHIDIAMEHSKPNEKVSPKGDSRLRVTRSERLWVINRVWSEDKARVIGYVAFESIQRSVYGIIGKSGDWVRYHNQYHPLHKPQELKKILEGSKGLEYGFFNNEVRYPLSASKCTDIAPFIYRDERSVPIA